MRYLTTNKLIELIALKASLPLTQVTFTEDNFLLFINEQLDMHIVPHVRSFQEDYFIVTELIPLENNVARYAIPSRASGNMLKDVCFTDDRETFSELTRISVEDVTDINYSGIPRFYLEAGDIVLETASTRPSGFLRVAYYQRPNEMVSETAASIVQRIDRNKGLVTVDKAVELFTTDDIYDITSSKQPHKLIAQDIIINGLATEDNLVMTFGTTKVLTLTFSNTFGDYTNGYITIVDDSAGTDANYTFYFGTAPVVPGTLVAVNITGLLTVAAILNALATAVTNYFSDGRLFTLNITPTSFDISNGGNGISVGDNFTVSSTLLTSTNVVSPGTNTIPAALIKNDVIALATQTIIPQVPSELHAMLAQGVAMRCLESLGDTQGLQNAAAKFAEMEMKTAQLINNRVESAPLKIVPRHSVLRTNRNRS